MSAVASGPLISVLLPVQAPAPWLAETLASLRSQSYEGWRLVAVVDGPDEDVESQLADFGGDRVVIEKSRGLPYALNQGLAACTTDYVARLDSDDRCWPDRFRRQLDVMQSDPELAVLGTSVVEIDETGDRIGEREAPTGRELLRKLRWLNKIVHPSVLMRREVIEQVGGYDEAAIRAEDYDLWLRVAAVAEVDNLAEPLLDYRMHTGQEWRRPIPPESVAAIGRSRREFAQARGESLFAADLRQRYWAWRRSGR